MTHSSFYKDNKTYTDFLSKQKRSDFHKYAQFVNKLTTLESTKFLDVGCGTGIALSLVSNNIEKIGIEISKTSVSICQKNKLNVTYYDGHKTPFSNNTFDIVGSFNVLEHTENPKQFLNEKYRVTNKGGYIILVCPSFLSITNNFYRTTKGLKNKLKNFFELLIKYFNNYKQFEYMPPVTNQIFRPDDDAICKTNPCDVLNWGKSKRLKLIYWSGCSSNLEGIKHRIDFFPIKMFLGSSFIVFKKEA